jgi:hypothetical protein
MLPAANEMVPSILIISFGNTSSRTLISSPPVAALKKRSRFLNSKMPSTLTNGTERVLDEVEKLGVCGPENAGEGKIAAVRIRIAT